MSNSVFDRIIWFEICPVKIKELILLIKKTYNLYELCNNFFIKKYYFRNSYPIRLIESRINFFLSNDQKPEKEPTDITLVFDYTSFVFFMSRFSSIEKGFRNDQARRNCEAYHIRLKRLKINDQKDLKALDFFKSPY